MTYKIAYGKFDKSPEGYFLPDDSPLRKAIDIALMLGKPLLLTGEPGTGKTELARFAASYLSQIRDKEVVPFLSEPLRFDTKTSSVGKDLFYEYDAVSHFHSRNYDGQDSKDKSAQQKPVTDFLRLAPLGKAIVQTWGKTAATKKFKLGGIKNMEDIADEPRSTVVLIDEIDKAPRDFPNDLLNEIENYKFYLTETGTHIERQQTSNPIADARILIIMTSNVEKNLPDAFLRRCIFYHIPFPSEKELREIVNARLGAFLNTDSDYNIDNLQKKIQQAITLFNKARESAANKKPATSELLDWMKSLHMYGLLKSGAALEHLDGADRKTLHFTLHTLFKSQKDFETFSNALSV